MNLYRRYRSAFYLFLLATLLTDFAIDVWLLEAHRGPDLTQGLTLKNLLLTGVDAVFVCALAIVALVYDRRRRKNEVALRSIIAQAELGNRALRQLVDARREALRTTVHDLKNPLGSIQGFSSLIEDERFDPQSVAEMPKR